MKKLFIPFMLFVSSLITTYELSAAAQSTAQENRMSEIVYLNSSNLQQVLNSSQPVIIDVYADWCGLCKKIAPIFQELHHELGNRYLFVKMNSDEQRALAERFNVRSLPTLLFIKDGKEVGRSSGFVNKSQLASMIQKYLGK